MRDSSVSGSKKNGSKFEKGIESVQAAPRGSQLL